MNSSVKERQMCIDLHRNYLDHRNQMDGHNSWYSGHKASTSVRLDYMKTFILKKQNIGHPEAQVKENSVATGTNTHVRGQPDKLLPPETETVMMSIMRAWTRLRKGIIKPLTC